MGSGESTSIGSGYMNQTRFIPSDFALPASPLLLIDDNNENLELLRKTLEWSGFQNVHCCRSAVDGLRAVADLDPHLIILDLRMPVMDGFEFLEAIQTREAKHGFLPILVFTADLTPAARTRALALGASDFLVKPGDPIEIKLRVRNFLRSRQLYGLLEKQNEQLESTVRDRTKHLEIARRESITLLARASEYRDDETGHHSQRVGEVSAAIAAELGLSPDMVEAIHLVAPLHDIGKISVPDQILHKPGPLTDAEFEIMKGHVSAGGALLAKKTSPLLRLAREIVLYHHERWDGSGYLAGLAGNDIPIAARIVSVADTFDAITNDRPYRKARSAAEALAEIASSAGTQFDPNVVNALRRVMSGQELVRAA